MKSLYIEFKRSGAVLHLDKVVEGFVAVNQDCLVNLGTQVGTDETNPSRGTTLEKLGLGTSSIVSLRDAAHLGNGASAETDRFITEDEDPAEEDPLQAIDVGPIKLQSQVLELNVITQSINGATIGLPTAQTVPFILQES